MRDIELCHKQDKQCTKCDLVYIIKDYVNPLMQLLSHELEHFHIRMNTTKCLNTGIMLMYFIGGRHGLNIVKKCDCEDTHTRHASGILENDKVLNRIKNQIKNKNFTNRQLYYILITDGYFINNTNESIYFPGHVFILEKFKDNDKVLFNMYQSYINQYDLKGHFNNMNESVTMTQSEVMSLISKIQYILNNDIWDTVCCNYWYSFTKVNSDKFLGYNKKNKIFICSDSMRLLKCINNIKTFILHRLKNIGNSSQNQIYGNIERYGNIDKYNNTKLYTNSQMKEELYNILHKMGITEYK